MDEWTKRFLWLSGNAALWIGGLTIMVFWFAKDPRYSDLPALLFVTGGVGAVLANYRRLSEIPEESAEVSKLLRRTALLQLCVAPFIGGTFALLLWMLFFTGILKGSLFPTIVGIEQPYNDWYHLMKCTRPETFADAAKGTIWAFIAGYAERFVPNVIDRIAKEPEAHSSRPEGKDGQFAVGSAESRRAGRRSVRRSARLLSPAKAGTATKDAQEDT
jgi:hypothetical protein